MRRGRVAVFWSMTALAGCSLFVDTSGLNDGTAAGSDGAPSDGSSGDGAASGEGSTDGGLSSSHYAQTILADLPIGYWRLGEAVAPVAHDEIADASGTYTNGVTLGAPGAIANDPNTAASIASGQYVKVPSTSAMEFSGTSPFSVEAWVNRTGGDGALGKEFYDAGYYGWMLVYNEDGGQIDFWRGSQEVSATNPGDGTFAHLVATFDGVNLLLFVNGAQVDANGTAINLPATGASFSIGRVPAWGDATAVIDEVALYDHALAPTRVMAHYQAGIGH